MTESLTPADLAELRELEQCATPFAALTINRYPHGGGRIFLDGESGERELIADFYNAAHREQYIALRTHAGQIIAGCAERDALASKLAKVKAGLPKLRREHVERSDPYESCPMHPEYPRRGERADDECDCGASAHNAALDALVGVMEKT